MPPARAPLAQSESKARFLERLGLNQRNDSHKRLYNMMKDEAVEGRKRVTEDPSSLAPYYQSASAVEPPYSNSQISETAMHREILYIYQNARPETRPIYRLGHDTDRVEDENWVIRWMQVRLPRCNTNPMLTIARLWHVFRYRDNRNRNRRNHSPSDGHGGGSAASPDGTSNSSKQRPSGQSSSTKYWDPVRDH